MTSVNFSGSNYGAYNKNTPPNRPSPEQMMKDIDTDGSGSLSLSEFTSFQPPGINGQAAPSADMQKQLFSKLDTDGNGQISEAELKADRPPGPPPGMNGGQGMEPQQAAAMQQHRQLVDQAFSQYGLNGQDIFKEVKQASGSEQPLPPDQMDTALGTVLKNHGLKDTQVTSLLNTIRPNNDSQ